MLSPGWLLVTLVSLIGCSAALGFIISGIVIFVVRRPLGRRRPAGGQVREASELNGEEKSAFEEKANHTSELSAVNSPQELSVDEAQRIAMVEDRVAAGYEGAYRGN